MGGVAAGQRQSQTGECPGILQHGRRHPPRLPPSRQHAFEDAASLPIPDDLLVEIFLRLPTPADVVRASAACVSFRRLVADRSFLQRLRKLHAPPLLGFLAHSRVFFPVTPPCPSASAASAVAVAADFSFSFLPSPARDWEVLAVRDSRVLLTRPTSDDLSMVVCDPLHRQYLLLPPIPEVEACAPSSTDSPLTTERHSFLGDEEKAGEETSFTVISIAQCGNKQAAFVFSSSTGQWRATPWTKGSAFFSNRRYAYGCFYGVTECREKMMAFDTRRMEFSLAELPPEARGSCDAKQDVDIAIVEAGEGKTGMFVLVRYTSNISYLTRQNSGGSSSKWKLEKTIPLGSSGYSFTGSTQKHMLLYHWGSTSLETGTFTLDINTFQLEKVSESESGKFVYSSFPPSLLSSPTISNGVVNKVEEMLEQGWAAKLKRIATAHLGWNSA